MASIKYKENGEYKDIVVKVGDTSPIGLVADYDGSVVPDGWEEVTDPNEYSTTEQVVGKWIDGKPLYRKVITGSSTNVDTLFNIDHNISNPEMYRITGDSFIRIGASSFPVNYPSGNTTNLDKRIIYSVMNATKIQLYVGSYLQSSGYEYCFVIQYTKTTD